jgi:hypothetical protein
MTPDHVPPDALFIQWGRFKAGASGRTAIVGLLGLIGAVVLVKLVGLAVMNSLAAPGRAPPLALEKIEK